jgi:hypothetical protein
VDWGTLGATVSGAVIAISGTVLADRLRHRREVDRGVDERRRAVYTELITTAGTCHARLRRLAQAPPDADRETAARAALTEAAIYEARERLFIDASDGVARAGQAMFERLRALQRAVAGGAGEDADAFHDANHDYIDAVWNYRSAVRHELQGDTLSPALFGWTAWDARDRCPTCTPPPPSDPAPASPRAGDGPAASARRRRAPRPGPSPDEAKAR